MTYLSGDKSDGIKKTVLEVKLEICSALYLGASSDLHLGMFVEMYLGVQHRHTANYDHT